MATDLFSVLDGAAAATAAPVFVLHHACCPRGWERTGARVVAPRSARPFVQFYTPPEMRAYQDELAAHARRVMKSTALFEGPLALRVFALMPIPRSWSRRDRDAAVVGTMFHTSTPDTDNIVKQVKDSFNKVVWVDDSQVVRELGVKEYGEHPGLIIEVYRLP